MHLVGSFVDRFVTYVTWVYIFQSNESQRDLFPLILIVSHASNCLFTLLRRSQIFVWSTYRWLIVSCIYTCLCSLLFSLENSVPAWVAFYALGGAFRMETPATLGLMDKTQVDQTRKLVGMQEVMFYWAEFSASIVVTLMIAYPSWSRGLFLASQLTGAGIFLVGSFLGHMRERAVISSTVMKHDVVLPANEASYSYQHALFWLAAVSAFGLFGLNVYVITVLLYQVQHTIVVLPVVMGIFSLLLVFMTFYSARNASPTDTITWLKVASFVFGVASVMSAITFWQMGVSSFVHVGVHVLALIPFSAVHTAPAILLREGFPAELIGDQLLLFRYVARGLGTFATWFSFVYLNVAPYTLLACICIAMWLYLGETHKAATAKRIAEANVETVMNDE